MGRGPRTQPHLPPLSSSRRYSRMCVVRLRRGLGTGTVPRPLYRLKIGSSMRPRRSFRVSRSAPSIAFVSQSGPVICESSRTIACKRAYMHFQREAARLHVRTAVGAFSSSITLTPRSCSEEGRSWIRPLNIVAWTEQCTSDTCSRRRSRLHLSPGLGLSWAAR